MRAWSFADTGAATASASSPAPSGTRQGGSHDAETGTPTSVVLDTDHGRGGSPVLVSGEGFGAGEVSATGDDTTRSADVTFTLTG